MRAYSHIEENLKALDSRFRHSRSIKDANFASKLAILELSGWIEVSIDDCIQSASARVLEQKANLKFMENSVRRTYGFEYERHFKPMIVSLIGVWGFEKISKSIDTAVEAKFKSDLDTLMSKRNRLAHTYTRGVTEDYDAPSTTIGRLVNLKAGLNAFDAALREYCPKTD